jgi:hypothetical protein
MNLWDQVGVLQALRVDPKKKKKKHPPSLDDLELLDDFDLEDLDDVDLQDLEDQLLRDAPKKKKRHHHFFLLFNPFQRNQKEIAHTSDQIAGWLEQSKVKLVDSKGLEQPLEDLIKLSHLAGYADGMGVVSQPLSKDYLKGIGKKATARAKETADGIREVTQEGQKKGSDYAFSPERADAIANHEAGTAYFQGLKTALGGFGLKKRWVTHSGDPCETCIETEAEGWIPFDSDFESEFDTPPGHPNCMCSLEVRI